MKAIALWSFCVLTLATMHTAQAASQVEYYDGGVSDQGVAEAKASAADYSLQILFSGSKGEYVAVDTLEITQGAQPILSLDQAGPYVFVKLPPGQYTVQATYGQVQQTKQVQIPSSLQSTQLKWTWTASEPKF